MKWLFGWSKLGFVVFGVMLALQFIMPESEIIETMENDSNRTAETQINRSASSPNDPNEQAADSRTGNYLLIPPVDADWETMWSGLTHLGSMYAPAHSVDEFLTPQQPGREPVNWSDPDEVLRAQAAQPLRWSEEKGIYLLETPVPQGDMMRVMVAYTDERLIKDGIHYWGFAPLDFLELALYHPRSQGIGFNSYVEEFSTAQVHAFAINKFYIASLIGYLLVEKEEKEEASLESHYVRALRAREQNQPYQAIYHAEQSRQKGETWEQGEIARIWAWHKLNFPGAQEMALQGIQYLATRGLIAPRDHVLETAIQTKLANNTAGDGAPQLSHTAPTSLFLQANTPLRLPFEWGNEG